MRLSVCLCVGITSSIYKLESDSSAHNIPLPLEVLLWQKIHGRNNIIYSTSCFYFLMEVFIKVMKVHVFISTVNNTNYSSYDYRVELDNHRQCLSTRRQTCTWMFLTMISYYDLMCKLSEECWDRRRAETTTLD